MAFMVFPHYHGWLVPIFAGNVSMPVAFAVPVFREFFFALIQSVAVDGG